MLSLLKICLYNIDCPIRCCDRCIDCIFRKIQIQFPINRVDISQTIIFCAFQFYNTDCTVCTIKLIFVRRLFIIHNIKRRLMFLHNSCLFISSTIFHIKFFRQHRTKIVRQIRSQATVAPPGFFVRLYKSFAGILAYVKKFCAE